MKTLILFLGFPGCGKGTQAEIISSKFGITNYSVGELLREYAKKDYEDAALVQDMLEKGLIIPADLVNKIAGKVIEEVPKICILDGYPRSIEQATFLHNYKSLKVVPIYFKLEQDLLIERISNRFQCKKCDKIYSKKSKDVTNFKCEKCGSLDYYKRSDDNGDVLLNRIEQFNLNTLPVLDFYKKLNLLQEIDASHDVEQVSQKLNKIIMDLNIDF
jgi:adenylate kinase